MASLLKKRKIKGHQGRLELQNEEAGVDASLSVNYLDLQVKVRVNVFLPPLWHIFTSYQILRRCLCGAPLLKIACLVSFALSSPVALLSK